MRARRRAQGARSSQQSVYSSAACNSYASSRYSARVGAGRSHGNSAASRQPTMAGSGRVG